ncbi:hypothetical protein LMG26854_03396 [Achromobacter aegrifaciens]|uniref:hypothetical protein n=1 Tax=Achromobacter aegrifaciens TaxID=1287736 RepID=UPI001467057D|nr:hypothetical protein [Achromobacter aegrifaciens]CAB3859501.1 hypothetical protein LMG26854_03396 [Achromobacter aegrifaciens]
MFRISIAAAVVLTLGACTTVKHAPISQDSLSKLEGKSIVSARYGQPDFTAFTAGKAAFAMLGAGAMVTEGNAIVKENGIEDPAIAISAGLQNKLASLKNTTAVQASGVAAKDDVATVVAASQGGDFVLDVKTLTWMFNYYPTDWAHYRVSYTARLRLIDAATKTVVAESACAGVQGDDENPPTKDQLLENGAGLLKDYLAKAGEACTEVLARDVLGL